MTIKKNKKRSTDLKSSGAILKNLYFTMTKSTTTKKKLQEAKLKVHYILEKSIGSPKINYLNLKGMVVWASGA